MNNNRDKKYITFHFLFPEFTWDRTFISNGGGWCESTKTKKIKFNTEICYSVDEEEDWVFTFQILGFGFVILSSIWSAK